MILRLARPVLFLGCAFSVLAQAPDKKTEDLRHELKRFTSVYELIESNFADKTDPDKTIYQGAIPSMLRTLDPHSNFFDPKASQALREDQQGHYYGVGMLVGAPDGHVTVMYPFQGAPAFKAGLRPGDVIVSVNDKKTERANVSEVSTLLRGPRGTKVTVEATRKGAKDPLWFHLVRDEVPRDSVDEPFWVQPGIALLKIKSFNENTSREVEEKLARLGERNVNAMILDLRDNPGGILQEAVAVADHFLKKGQSIVTHHGRASAEAKFIAKKGERGREYPIVVLVNRGSASAAEILAGALQDHDRAWILGENTFGKGLVQAPYGLSGDTALLLTVARYYTPSGRLIQRDYSHKSFFDYYSRKEGKNDLKDTRRTDAGRLVYGGDGITPDEHWTEPKLPLLAERLSQTYAYFYFAVDYFATHPKELAKSWKPDNATIESFRQFLDSKQVKFTAAEFDEAKPYLMDRLREELFVTAFAKEDAEQLALQSDPELKKALESLPASRALLDRVKQNVAGRAATKPGLASTAVPVTN